VIGGPRAILFDFDGTLVDTRLGIVRSARHALERLNAAFGRAFAIPDEASLTGIVGPPLRATLAGLAEPDLVEPAMTFYRERYATIGLYESRPFDGVAAMLDALLDDRRKLFVATSKNEADARRLLDHFGLLGRFQSIYGARPDGARSDKAEVLQALLADESIAKGEAIMVGDRKFDVAGATALGLPTLGVLWGYGGAEELTQAGAAALIERPDELPDALRTFAEAAL
jgi:phosphoglycolate phosphatase